MKVKISAGIIALTLLAGNLIFPSAALSKGIYLLSTGALKKYSIEHGKIQYLSDILDYKKWGGQLFPSCDQQTGNIYFSAQDTEVAYHSSIYYINLSKEVLEPQKVIKGRLPAISPDGNLLAYYIHPNQLWTLELQSKNSKRMATDIINRQPAVWISNKQLLYTNVNKQLVLLNVFTGQQQQIDDSGIIPGALSPDGTKVLCGSWDGMKIYIYSTDTNKLKLLEKNFFYTMGTNFVWAPDGKSFLYARHTLLNTLKLLLEAQDLFQYFFATNEEVNLLNNVGFAGGIFLPSGS